MHGHRIHATLWTAATTGMRPSELAGLHWGDLAAHGQAQELFVDRERYRDRQRGRRATHAPQQRLPTPRHRD